jgi:23S rRNA (pseudouridine1915-N3)-methyltransferase
MRISVIAVGKVKGPLAEVVREYEARASRYWKLEVVEVPGGPGRGSEGPDEVRAREAERIRSRLPDEGEVWALTRAGKEISSVALARELGDRALQASPRVIFLLGGAFGLAPSLLGEADRRLSLSSMTLPHEAARLLLAEQLYRAGTILRGEPYHKGGG